MITLLLPILGCLSLNYAIGGSVDGLTLGIVNHEIKSLDECFNSSLMTTQVTDYECTLHKASCRFITQFDPKIAKLVSET